VGRLLLCGKEAQHPYVVEDLDLRIRSAEELCYYIYHNVALLPDGFFDERLLRFLEEELEMKETAEKIRRFCHSESDEDNTLYMLLSENGFYRPEEMEEFRARLAMRRRRNGPEKTKDRGDALVFQERYRSALRAFRSLKDRQGDARITQDFYVSVLNSMADCYGCLGEFDKAYECLVMVYEETRSMEILKKMYEVCNLSDIAFPDCYANRIPSETMRRWERSFQTKVAVAEQRAQENPVMECFLHDPEKAREELCAFADAEKEKYRKMLE